MRAGPPGAMNKAWLQFLLVAVPLLSLVGAWLALRVVSGRRSANNRTKANDE